MLVLAPALLVSIIGLLRLAPPESHNFYPACPLHQLTGLLCPGCGATRALAALLRGNFTAAWRSNALVMLLLPVAALVLTRGYVRLLRGRSLSAAFPAPPRAITALLLAVALLFSISRNLP